MQHAACRVTINGQTNIVVGFENHSGRTTLGSNAQPFGTVVAGAGNNSTDGTEGARQRNVFATYLHGPVLPKNPWLADALAQLAWERKVGGSIELTALDDSVEQTNHDKALDLALAHVGEATVLQPAQLARGARE
jgi:CobQ-like glutamine amidotransferase family enzyme